MTLKLPSGIFVFRSSGTYILSKVITSVRAESREAVYPMSLEAEMITLSLSAVLSKAIFST